MHNHFFHKEAKDDLADAIDYYESRQPGFGLEFADEVQATIAGLGVH